MSGKKRGIASADDRLLYALTFVLVTLVSLSVLYPLIYIVSASFSSSRAVISGKVVLWPVEPGIEGYKAVFRDRMILQGYANTIFYTLAGTLINVALTMMAAYPLSREDLRGRGALMFLFTFTMLFNGGLIPNYILMNNLRLTNTRWAMLLPGAIAVYNLMIARSFLQSSLPHELLEAAQIDGCSDARYFFSILLPLSKAIIAVLTLYYAVAHWNAYFEAFLYLSRQSLFPLQLILRDILVSNQIDASMVVSPEEQEALQGLSELLKYSLIVVSTVPILLLYPFVQRYFVQGVMMGSVKG